MFKKSTVLSLVFSLALALSTSQNTEMYKSSQVLSESQTLKQELCSLGLDCEILDTKHTSQEKSVILPRSMLNLETLTTLGFDKKELTEISLSYGEIVVPKGASGLFLFNSSDSTISSEIRDWAPFSLSKYARLVDYHMILPYNFHHIGTKLGLLEGRDNILEAVQRMPSSTKLLQESEEALLVLIFECGDTNAEELAENLPLSTVKEYNHDSIISQLFNLLAQKWINLLGYKSLISSTFCTVNVEFPEQSVCLKMTDYASDSTSVSVFPAYVNDDKHKRDLNYEFNLDGILGEGHERRLAHSMRVYANHTEILYHSEKIPDHFEFDGKEHRLPLETVKKLIEPVISETAPRSKEFRQVVQVEKPSQLNKRDKTDAGNCVPVTWFSVFHHSIFGKPKNFCVNEPQRT